MSEKSKIEDFNIVIAGIGGQGLITLLKILAEAAMTEDYELRTSELHGLSQRGGSVEVHIRFGKKIYSPLVNQGGADLIITLEAQEALKACYYASKGAKTGFLVNDFFSPIQGSKKIPSEKEILKTLQGFSQKAILIPADKICQKELGTSIVAGIFILGLASNRNLISLKSSSFLKAIEKIIPGKFLDLNKKAFELGRRYETGK